MQDDENLEYIKNFSKISITDVCKKEKVSRSNLLTGKCKDSKEKTKRVKKRIESEIAKLYVLDNEEMKEGE